MYTFRLRLRDATGEIDGLVFKEDGQAFFRVRVLICSSVLRFLQSKSPVQGRLFV